MLELSAELREAFEVSRRGDRVAVAVWYDGEVVVPDLPLSSWSLTEDATRSVGQQVSFSVPSEDGALIPWSPAAPLGVAGPRAQLSYVVDGVGVLDLGWFRLTRSDPKGRWRLRRLVYGQDGGGVPTAEAVRWSSSGTVDVAADDLTKIAQLDRFLGPETAGSGSVLDEVARLLDGIVPVRVLDGVGDGSVPSSITYDRDRLAAVESLLGSIDARHRMGADGVLEVIPATPGPVVWTLRGGEGGVLIDFGHSMSAEDFPNVAVVEGKAPAGADGKVDRPLIGIARERTGPLRAGGPHGSVPAFLSSDLMDTQTKVDLAARTRLAAQVSERTATLSVRALVNPALRAGDVVRIETPAGDLVGPIQGRSLGGSADSVPAEMTLTVTVPWPEFERIARKLERERGAGLW